MNGVFSSISAESTSDRVWCLFPSNLRVSWSNELSPPLDSIVSNQLHSDADVRRHEVGEIIEERLSSVLSIKSLSRFFAELGHLHSVDLEPTLLYSVYNFSKVLV